MEMGKEHCCSTIGGCGVTVQIAIQLTQTLLTVCWPLVTVFSVVAPRME